MKTTVRTIVLAGALLALLFVTGWQLAGSWAVLMVAGFLGAVLIGLAGKTPAASFALTLPPKNG